VWVLGHLDRGAEESGRNAPPYRIKLIRCNVANMSAPEALRVPADPLGVLRLVGHPVRWRLLGELASSDRRAGDLATLLDLRQNLASYHLGLLRRAGLVATHRSTADGRDTWYRLDVGACRDGLAAAGPLLHPALRFAPAPPVPSGAGGPPVRVLFLCTGNSARSPMAEALLRAAAGDAVDATSAGSHPHPVRPEAVAAMAARGLDISGHRPRHLDELAGRAFDHVITVCDRVREVCPELPEARSVAHWSMADPGAATDPDAFVRTADELAERVDHLLPVLATGRTRTMTRGERR
jgi:protein-tyrosine-phosphatase/DNA-binding transcriptional ArsR family regulator